MFKKAIVWGGGLIALYLVVEHYTGSGVVLDKSAGGLATVTKALQGR